MTSYHENPIEILDTTDAIGVGSGGSVNIGGGASIGRNTYIGGNISVHGTSASFADNILLLNENPNDSSDTGIIFQRNISDVSNNNFYSGIVYSEANDEFVFTYLTANVARGSITINDYTPIKSNSLTLMTTSESIGVGTGGALTILGGAAVSKDLYIGGNLIVGGESIQQQTFDNLIVLNATPNKDGGVLIKRYIDGQNDTSGTIYAGMFYDESTDEITFGLTNNTANNITLTEFLPIRGDALTLVSTTDASGIGTGGNLTVLGGASISKTLYVGSNAYIEGDLTVFGNTNQQQTSVYEGNVIVVNGAPLPNVDGGLLMKRYVDGVNETSGINFVGVLYKEDEDEFIFASTNNSGNTLTITEYLPIKANSLILNNTDNAIGVGSGGTLTVLGGAAISKDLYVDNKVYTEDISSTNITTVSVITSNLTSFNIDSTNVSSSNATINSLSSINITNTNLSSSNSLITNLTNTNLITNFSTITNLLNTNGTINSLFSTNLTNTNLSSSNSTITNILNTNLTNTNLSSSNSLITNLSNTNLTSGITTIDTHLIVKGNANTIANIYTTNGNVGINQIAPNYTLDINGNIKIGYDTTSPASGSTRGSFLTIPSISFFDNISNVSQSNTWYGSFLGKPYISSLNNITYNTAATLSIEGAPLATGGNLSISNPFSLYVQSGNVYFGGNATFKLNNTPSLPPNLHKTFYLDTGSGFFKSIDSDGVIKTYNPSITKGDLIVHDGSTEVRFPIGFTNQILYVDPSSSTGVSWKDLSSDTGLTNAFASKYFEFFNTAITSLSDTYTDIVFDTIRATDTDYFSVTNNVEVKFKFTGRYLVLSRVTTQALSGNQSSQSSARIMLANTAGNYSVLNGTLGFMTNISSVNQTSTCFTSAIINVLADEEIKIQAKRDTGNMVLQTYSNGCNLFICKVAVDENNDNSKYYNSYTNVSQTIGNTFTDIAFHVDRTIDTTFSHVANSAEIQFNESGRYLIYCNASFNKTTGNDPSIVQAELAISDTSGSNYTSIPGTIFNTYHQPAPWSQTGSTNLIYDVETNQRIKLRALIETGSNIESVALGTSISIVKLQSTTNSQSTPKFIDLYDTTTQIIGSSYTDLTLNSQRIINDVYTHSTGGSTITFTESGRYIITSKIVITNTNTNNNNQSSSQMRILLDTGNGFSEVSGSLTANYNRVNLYGKNTLQTSLSLNISQNSQIKFQAIRASGTGNIETVPNTFNVSIFRIDIPPGQSNALLKFGTEYQYSESLAPTATSSTVYIEKLRLTTNNIPEGNYRIGVSYIVFPSNNSAQIDCRVQIDDTDTIQTSQHVFSTNSRTPICDFKQVQLTAGLHNIDLDFKASNGVATIENAKLEIWRVA